MIEWVMKKAFIKNTKHDSLQILSGKEADL